MSVVELPVPAPVDVDDGDAFLDMPLTGTRLIEASAGTGKTYTLATIVTRLVVERGMRVGQVLAVTYTEAATQELRERLRQRLSLLARMAAGATLPDDDSEVALCRRLVERQQRVEDPAALRRRLQRAARELDTAAVYTIHGFCTRVLADNALETGEPFDAAGVVGNDRELREIVAHDLWRAIAAEPVDAEVLRASWSSPDALAKALDALLRAPRLLPAPVDAGPSPIDDVRAAAQALREAWYLHGVDARAAIDAAIADGVLSRTSYRAPTLAALFAAMDGWSRGASVSPPHDKLELLTAPKIAACTNKMAPRAAPASPLFDAATAFVDARARHEDWLVHRKLALIHRVRDEGAQRLERLKRQRRVRSFDDLIDGVARALDGPHAHALIAQLRRQYHAALVDEFQDTDARQWSIFRRVFGDDGDDALPALDDAARPARFLALIGDPKQAIYGFRGGDVHTYLRARDSAQPGPPLDRNFRSRPCLLRTVDRLYAGAGDDAFGATGIGFRSVAPGGGRTDAACLRDGVPAPALTVRRLPPREDGKPFSADESRERAALACTHAIHETLQLAAAGRLHIDGRDGPRAPGSGDIAVLVRKHRDGLRLARLLAQAGIPAVTAAPTSLFETAQAMELLAVFDALLAPADPRRLHAALATALIGLDAARIDALLHDDVARARELGRALGWRERWLRAGPLALVEDLCAQAAPRLLELSDGERRLSDFIQLGEALQEASQHVLGPQALVDWLRARIAGADGSDREQQLRLESDAQRVQILTVHGSKGLEFPFVFLPFMGIADGGRSRDWCDYDDGEGRVLHVQPDPSIRARQAEEAAAEEARLLYVALTRAQHALWVCDGPLFQHAKTPIAPMLAALQAGDASIVVDAREPEGTLPAPLHSATPRSAPGARHAHRVLARDWAIYSFSALARLGTGTVETLLPRGERIDATEPLLAGDAAPDLATELRAAAADDARFSGARFGDVVHGAFETVDFAAWRDWRDGPPPAGQPEALIDAFRAEGYSQADIDDGLPLLTSLVGHTLTVAMPEGARLCDVPEASRRAEMEFHFSLSQVDVDALLSTVQAHGLLAGRAGFGARRRLDGLMTGKIDLVYAHGGRYHVLDYKTNRLPDYAPPTLERAMHDGEYTLQAAIYSLALHRWLRFRLGDAYDYTRDFGGIRYVFCRGMNARDAASAGIHAARLPLELVDALDALFGGAR
jgi:exodeoxyribonuclease V beta subunit